MNKSAKIVFYTAVVSFVTMLLSINVNALQFTPDKVEYNDLERLEIEIFSAYDKKADGISIKFEVQDGIVLDYLPEAGRLLNLGTCEGDVFFTESEVCIDSVNPEGIMFGDKLGTLVIATKPGKVTLIIPNGTKYINQTLGEKAVLEGILGVYSEGATSLTPEFTLSIIQEIVEEDEIVYDNVSDSIINPDDSSNDMQISSNTFVVISLSIFLVTVAGVIYILKKKHVK